MQKYQKHQLHSPKITGNLVKSNMPKVNHKIYLAGVSKSQVQGTAHEWDLKHNNTEKLPGVPGLHRLLSDTEYILIFEKS